MKSTWIALCCGTVCASLALASPALAQSDLRALLDRVDRLERDLGTVQREVYRGGSDNMVVTSPLARDSVAPESASQSSLPTEMAARIEVRLTQLENELRRLTGQVEEANYAANQVGSRLDRAMADVEFRLKELERHGAQGAGSTPAEVTPDTAPFPTAPGPRTLGTIPLAEVKKSPSAGPVGAGGLTAAGPSQPQFQTAKEQYGHALKLLRSDYAAAEKALVAFLEMWPDDPLAGNAQYWLGETYYVRNEHDKAAVAFLKAYQKYSKSAKAPDSLLKLGLSLAGLGQQKEACAAYGRLASEFSDAAEQVKRRVEAERQKLNCR